MKIVIFANSASGLYKFRKELLERLISLGHQIFISLPKGDFINELQDLGCNFIETKISRHGTNPFTDFRLLKKYKSILKELTPDIVFTYTIKPNIYGGIACASKNIPYIVNITGLGIAIENSGLLQKFVLFLYKYGLRKAKRVFFQNQENQIFMINHNVVKDNYKLIPGSGVNLNNHCFENYPIDDGMLRFLFIGRLMKDKGIEELFDCIEYIQKKYKNIEFDIIGGYDEDKYQSRIVDLENKGYLKYWGIQKDVHNFIKSHHVTVLPSYHEGMSNVLLESAACGRPVIATDIPGCKEIFDDTISGISCMPRSVDSLINAVERFIHLPYEQKARMGIAGRKKVEKEFDRNIVVDSYIKEL